MSDAVDTKNTNRQSKFSLEVGRPLPPDYVPALRFPWLTQYYDAVVGSTTRERAFKQALIVQAGIAADHQVLDLACGTATLALMAKRQQPLAKVTGIDGDPDILRIATEKARNADMAMSFDQGLSYALPYATSSFDRVLSSLFFHHLSLTDKQRTANEVFRVLKPGGEFHVADWGRPTNLVMRGLFCMIQLLDGFENTQDNVSGRLIEVFKHAGFSDVAELKSFSTIFGTLSLYRATKGTA